MGGKQGVKETKEAILALVVLGNFVAMRLKDGAQMDDATALGQKLLLDASFKAKIMAGIEGRDKIQSEVTELDLADVLELAKVLPEILKEIEAA